jgi:hypothetical protein
MIIIIKARNFFRIGVGIGVLEMEFRSSPITRQLLSFLNHFFSMINLNLSIILSTINVLY